MRKVRLRGKAVAVLGAVVLGVLGGLLALPAARDEVRWRLAELRDTKRAYSDFAERARVNSRRRSPAYERASERLGCLRPNPRISPRLFWRWMRWDGSANACVGFRDVLRNSGYLGRLRQKRRGAGRAIVEIVRVAFVRRVLDSDSTSVTLRGGSMDIDVAAWGTAEAEAEREMNWRLRGWAP
jgi:hypothetical protein